MRRSVWLCSVESQGLVWTTLTVSSGGNLQELTKLKGWRSLSLLTPPGLMKKGFTSSPSHSNMKGGTRVEWMMSSWKFEVKFIFQPSVCLDFWPVAMFCRYFSAEPGGDQPGEQDRAGPAHQHRQSQMSGRGPASSLHLLVQRWKPHPQPFRYSRNQANLTQTLASTHHSIESLSSLYKPQIIFESLFDGTRQVFFCKRHWGLFLYQL